MLPLDGLAQSPAAGSIEGRVINNSTGASLGNAQITVEGTAIETITNKEGEYRLSNVPAGDAKIRVAYSRMEPASATVTVQAGQVSQQNFNLSLLGTQLSTSEEVVVLDKLIVESRRLSAQADAINAKRIAPNITEAISLGEIGKMADANVGEYLKYTPGVIIGNSPQIASSIQIRGMPASGTIVMLDGVQITGAGTTRGFNTIGSGAVAVDRIEVSKVPTPDMPANAVGGTVNLIGKNGFNKADRGLFITPFLTFNTQGGFNLPGFDKRARANTDERAYQPGLNLSYVGQLSDTVAVSLDLGYTVRMFEMEFIRGDWDRIKLVQFFNRVQTLQQYTDATVGAATVNWKITKRDTLRATIGKTGSVSNTYQNSMATRFGAGYTGNDNFTQGAPTGVDRATHEYTWGDYTDSTNRALAQYKHDGDVWKIEASGSISRSYAKNNDTDNGFFSSIGHTSAPLIIRAEGLYNQWKLTPMTNVAKDLAGNLVDIYHNAKTYTIQNATSSKYYQDKKSWNAYLNVSRDFDWNVPVSLKVGGAVNYLQTIDETPSQTWTFSPPGGTAGAAAGNFDLINTALSNYRAFESTFNVTWLSPVKLYNLFKAHPDYFVLDATGAYINDTLGARELEETVSAAYIRADVKLMNNKLLLVGGFRYEKTSTKGLGPNNDLARTYQRDGAGVFLRDGAGKLIPITTVPLEKAKLQYLKHGAVDKNTYDGMFPSFNAKYLISDTLLVRAGYAKTIGRPELGFIIPGTTISDPAAATKKITVVNLGLKPWTSDNYDVTVEAYNLKGAVLTASLFRKDLHNFFASALTTADAAFLADQGLSSAYLNYEVATQINSGEASISGLELSWKQSLSSISSLPDWANGFQLYAQYTSQKKSGTNALDFSDFSKYNYAFGVGYVRRNFMTNVNVTMRGATQGSKFGPNGTTPPGYFNYEGALKEINVSFQYRFTKHLSVFGNSLKVTGDPRRNLVTGPDMPSYANGRNFQNNGTNSTAGVTWEF